jgi:hypothetical protein
MAKDVIVIHFEKENDKIYYDIKFLSGAALIKGKCSIKRFEAIKKRIAYDYPKYPFHEVTTSVIKYDLKANLDLTKDDKKKGFVLPREKKFVKYKFNQ